MTESRPLTDVEAAAVRILIRQVGAKEAAKLLGLCDERTILKAGAGDSLHAYTVLLIRERLPRRL